MAPQYAYIAAHLGEFLGEGVNMALACGPPEGLTMTQLVTFWSSTCADSGAHLFTCAAAWAGETLFFDTLELH